MCLGRKRHYPPVEARLLPFDVRRPNGRALRVLCLGAHSDDIEIGCGGTVLTLARAGADIHWAVFSGTPARAEEASRSASRFLGKDAKRRLSVHTFRDGFFPVELGGVKEAVEAVAARVKPDMVFTHYRHDRHQDHRVLSDLAWNTFRHHIVLEYEIPKWDGDLGIPNLYMALTTAAAKRKVRLLMQGFASQRNKDWFTESTFYSLMRLRGLECRAEAGMAEAFHARKALMRFPDSSTKR